MSLIFMINRRIYVTFRVQEVSSIRESFSPSTYLVSSSSSFLSSISASVIISFPPVEDSTNFGTICSSITRICGGLSICCMSWFCSILVPDGPLLWAEFLVRFVLCLGPVIVSFPTAPAGGFLVFGPSLLFVYASIMVGLGPLVLLGPD